MAIKLVCSTCGYFGEPKYGKKECQKCGGKNLIPADSPVGKKMLADSGMQETEIISVITTEKQKSEKSRKRKIYGWTFGILGWIIFLTIMTNTSSPSSTSTAVQETSPFGNYENVNVGDEAYLWLAHDDSTRGLVCLGTTKEDYDKIGKAFIAKDYYGLLEVPGAFCVGSGTKVKLIEKDFPLRRVRILQGAGEVDNDKVGLSGWTATEFVVK